MLLFYASNMNKSTISAVVFIFFSVSSARRRSRLPEDAQRQRGICRAVTGCVKTCPMRVARLPTAAPALAGSQQQLHSKRSICFFCFVMLFVSRTACGGAAVGSRATAMGKVRALNQTPRQIPVCRDPTKIRDDPFSAESGVRRYDAPRRRVTGCARTCFNGAWAPCCKITLRRAARFLAFGA